MNKIKLSHSRVFKSLWTSQKRVNAFRGGARSSKTWSILQAIAYWLLTGKFGDKSYPKGSFSIVRETLPSLRASAYKDFIAILDGMQMYNKVDHRKTILEFHYRKREVNFFSSDDPHKMKGRQQTFFYMNEANNMLYESFHQLIIRTEAFGILDYNPAAPPSGSNWVKEIIEEKRLTESKDVKLDVSTYKDNKHIPAEMVKEIEGLKETDYDLWQVYTLGNWVKSRNLVFEKIHLCKRMPTEDEMYLHNLEVEMHNQEVRSQNIQTKELRTDTWKKYYGLDFGYNDPNVAIRVYKKEKELYIEQLVYKRKQTLNQLADDLSMINGKFYCDHSPLIKKELKSKGIRLKNADKKEILQGLGFIRQHKIHILETSLETIKEFREYKYKLDDDNNPTDQPLDYNNHSVDAVRYALSFALRGGIRVR